jgi:predicted acylesterase/phospholipase RssA
VLSGGGAYAAYEVGVMRALIHGESPATGYAPVDPGVITGTSAGSFNAALFASAPSVDPSEALDYVQRIWLDHIGEEAGSCTGNVIRLRANVFGFLNPACLVRESGYAQLFSEDVEILTYEWSRRSDAFFTGPGTLRQRFIEAFDLATFLSARPLRDLLDWAIRSERIVSNPRAIRIAATNWRTGELRVFGNDELTGHQALAAVLASSAIPGVFASIEIEGDPYVDGGVVMNTPLRPALRAGATEIHVVYMDPDVRNIPLPQVRNTLNTFYRMLVVSFGLVVSRDIGTVEGINRRIRRDRNAAQVSAVSGAPRENTYRPVTAHRYFPTDDLGGTFRWLDFDRAHITRLIERGYEDTIRHDCERNRCVFAERDSSWHLDDTAEWARHDA